MDFILRHLHRQFKRIGICFVCPQCKAVFSLISFQGGPACIKYCLCDIFKKVIIPNRFMFRIFPRILQLSSSVTLILFMICSYHFLKFIHLL